jgi:hypothetical protein
MLLPSRSFYLRFLRASRGGRSMQPSRASGGEAKCICLFDRKAAEADVFDFELTDDQMTQIAGMDTGASLFFDHRDPAIVAQFAQRHLDV